MVDETVDQSVNFTRDHPSPVYLAALEEAKAYHLRTKAYDGGRTFKAFAYLHLLCKAHRAETLLDYGSGKNRQHQAVDVPVLTLDELGNPQPTMIPNLTTGLGVSSIYPYDPAVPGFDTLPVSGVKFDGVYCVDVLQVIPPQDVPWVVRELSAYASKFIFVKFRINTVRAKKTELVLPQTVDFWTEVFQKNCDPQLDVVLRLRDPEVGQLLCRRRPGASGFEIGPAK